MSATLIRVTSTSPHDAISLQLIAELSAELGALYGDDGAGAFTPEDVTVPRAAFVVAWLNDVPAGCGALRPMDNASTGEIKRMYVRREFRGNGISKRILAALEARAREFGYTFVWLETGVRQQEAVSLYEKSGYTRRACYGQYADDPESLCYEKQL